MNPSVCSGFVLEYLEDCKKQGNINNPGIIRMVGNYFFELALLIFASPEC